MSLTIPKLLSEKSLEELLKLILLQRRTKGQSGKRYKFNKIYQEDGESLNEFIVRLKSAAQTCRFGDFLEDIKDDKLAKYKSLILDEALADRFIVGVKSDKIQEMVLRDDSLTFEKVCQQALNVEASHNASRAIQPMSQNVIFNQQKKRFYTK